MRTSLIDVFALINKIPEKDIVALKEEALKSGKKDEEFLLSKFPEDLVFKAKSKFFGVPLKELQDNFIIPAGTLSYIPEEVSKNYKIIPLMREGGMLHIGMVNPQDIRASDAIKFIMTSKNLNAKIFLITNSQFEKLYKQYSTLGTEVKEALAGLEDDISDTEVDEVFNQDKADKLIEEAPINKVVAVIFKHAYEGKASDIHIEPLEKDTRVRFRMDGSLQVGITFPKDIHATLVSKIKILSNLKIDETRIPQDGRFRTRINGNPIDFRVSTFPTVEGEKVVLRLLDPTLGIKSLEERGFLGYSYEVIKRSLDKPFGMILVTGPTGSGKSTTLQSILAVLNNEKVNIVSLEDPVEYYVGGVNQSQVRSDIDYTFASGLRSILRQDPDIIMVGEIRDNETAALAVHAALTGHIVLSTLHTNDALGVIPRLVDMQVESFLLPASLNLVVAQRLVKRLCLSCRYEVKPEGRAKEILDENISNMPSFLRDELSKKELKIYKSKGCPKCNGKGTAGRIVIFEVLEMTSSLKDIIINNELESKIQEEAKKQNMITMRQDGILKALDGIVSLEDVLQSTV